jgi:hypothetical protein
MPGVDSYGQKWYIEAAPARLNTIFPASSVYVDDLTVYAFHFFDGSVINPLRYDISTDGGATFPAAGQNTATAFSPVGSFDVFGSAIITLADGTRRIILLANNSEAIIYSDTVFTLPGASTWARVQPTGNVGAPVGFGVRGLNVVVCGQAGGAVIALSYSLDGGATFAAASTGIPDTVVTSYGMQLFASPVAHVWCFINPKSGIIYRSADDGVTWSGAIKTITAGNVGVPTAAAIWAVNATRLVAVYKGQIVTSDDEGLTWTDRQNLTLNPPSTTAINQGDIAHFGSFGLNAGIDVLGAVSAYPHEFNGATTRGAMWRSVDKGTSWSLVDCVGGSNLGGTNFLVTGFAAQAGRAVMDMREGGGPARTSWYNPNPAPVPAPPAVMGAQLVGACSAFTVCPCPTTCD